MDSLRRSARDSLPDSLRLSIEVETNYNDSDESLAQIRSLISTLPPIRSRQDEEISVESLIVLRYGLGAGDVSRGAGVDVPRTVSLLAASIRELNGWSPRELTRPGVVYLPPVPRRNKSGWNQNEPKNFARRRLVATLTQPATYDSTHSGPPLVIDSGFVEISDGDRSASPLVLVEVTLPKSSADTLIAAIDSLLKRGGTITSEGMELRFGPLAAANAIAAAAAPNPAFYQSLTAAVRGRRIRARVPLVIIDVGWPSSEAREASVSRLLQIVDTVRLGWGLGQRTREVQLPEPFSEPGHPHAKLIEEALEGFERSELADAVDVIYVPLTKDQGAEGLLEELLATEELLRLKVDLPTDDLLRQRLAQLSPACRELHKPRTYPACARTYRLPPRDDLAARARVAPVLAALPPRFVGKSEELASMRGSTAILSAMWSLLDAWALMTNRAAFVNASWTVPTKLASFNTDETKSSLLLLVAAVGNDSLAVNTDEVSIEFGRRSSTNKRVLSVMNQSGDGTWLCKSSFLDPATIEESTVVAFSGAIALDRSCGTSFAAPRVAWLLALDEALRSAPVPNYDAWASRLDRRLRASRNGAVLDPIRFLSPR